MYCRSCGENIPVDSIFCPSCGKNLLEVSSPTYSQKSVEGTPVADTEIPAPDTPLSRLRRFRRSSIQDENEPVPEEPSIAPGTEEEPHEPDEGSDRLFTFFQGLSVNRVLWVMGLLFSAVGFIIGLLGDLERSLAWLLFGLALIVAGPNAPELRSAELVPTLEDTAQEESTEEEMGD